MTKSPSLIFICTNNWLSSRYQISAVKTVRGTSVPCPRSNDVANSVPTVHRRDLNRDTAPDEEVKISLEQPAESKKMDLNSKNKRSPSQRSRSQRPSASAPSLSHSQGGRDGKRAPLQEK